MDLAELREKLALLSVLPDKLWEKAIDWSLSVIQSEISLHLGLEDELGKLRRTGERISALLRDAEERRVIDDEQILQWLRDLKDVALDADDVIDEFETRLRRGGAAGRPQRSQTRKRAWYSIASAPSPLILFRRRVATEIKEIYARFDGIYRDRKRLRLRGSEARRRVPPAAAPPTAAIFSDEPPRVVGRDDEGDELVRLLVPDEKTDTSKSKGPLVVIPIYGMPGLGKTTLAKCVFNDEKVEGQFKARRIWICATKGFDVERMTKEILESLTGEPCNLSNFNLVQCRVREQLLGKTFLLVLDDVREDGPQHWEHLRVCLPSGKEGRSRVLITTRHEDVARRMGTVQRAPLRGLKKNDCLRLFERRAFPSGGLDRLPRLKEIGEQIASKCQGSPLAAISLGGLLHNDEDETEWRSVLNEAAEFSQAENDILPKLKLTYEHLPLHLKKCFAFCAIFPDGYLFDKDMLIRLWIAEGFIERRGSRRLDAIGSRYFDELLWRSFFQVSERIQKEKLRYKIPSLFYDLAQSVSRYECFKMVDNEPKPHDPSENARHTLLFSHRTGCTPTFMGFHKYKRLRTFSLKGDDRVVIRKLPSDLFLKLRCLRVLDLSDSTITELPDSVGELKLLRYLGLCKTWIEWLLESVTTLCNLQTLELSDCYKLLGLPEGTSNLVNLRHLGLHLEPHKCSNLTSMPPGIGNLSCLETLSRFIVGTRDGCRLSEIEHLNLRGELWMSKLENVVSTDDAKKANLQNKLHIDTLTLEWSDCECHTMQDVDRVRVIEHLHPPTQLKNLCVYNYDGSTVPSWLGSRSFFGLVNLRLSYCKQWKSFPPLGQLPALKELFVEGMHSMTRVEYQLPDSGGASFNDLEKLVLCDFPALETWSKGVMPRLRELYISQCPKLTDVPNLPFSLTKLAIKGCQALSKLPPLPILEDLLVEDCAPGVLDMVGNLTCLSSLTISHILSLNNIPEKIFQSLTALNRFEITDCKKLRSVAGNNKLQGLTSLDYLKISSCPELEFISRDGLPAKLKDLRLCHCYKLTSIPWKLHDLTSLQHLEIRDIPRVDSWPNDTIYFSKGTRLPKEGVFSSLQHLAISGCPFLELHCKDNGIYWSKIKNVFYVEINFKVLSVNQRK